MGARNVCHPSSTRPGAVWMMHNDNDPAQPTTSTLDSANPASPPPLPSRDGFEHAPDGHIVVHGPVTGEHPAPTPPLLPVSEIFDEGTTFAQLGLRNSVLKGIEAMGFKQPTSIQSSLIPVILS